MAIVVGIVSCPVIGIRQTTCSIRAQRKVLDSAIFYAMSTFEVHNIRLEPPNISYQGSYLSAMAEFQGDSEKSAWIYLGEDEPHDTPAKDFASYVSRLRSVEATAPPNFVRSTCYWAIYRDEVIGRIAIRHELNDFL